MNILSNIRTLTRAALTVLTLSVLLTACGEQPDTALAPDQPAFSAMKQDAPGLQRAMEVQTRNTERFLEMKGVVGTGTGMDEEGNPTMIIFTERALGKGKIPEHVEDIPVREEVVGVVEALSWGGKPTNSKKNPTGTPSSTTGSPTDRLSRPVPIGSATSNWYECGSATLGVRVRRGDAVFVLSNNHVFGRMNNALSGEIILQPGRSDVSCTQNTTDEVGRVADVQSIVFSTSYDNLMDAAMASTTVDLISNSTPTDGYGIPSSTTAAAYIGMPVQKYGRSSRLTEGKVSAINVIVGINYSCGSARFINQIAIQPARKNSEFAIAGDSGSLVVTDDSNANPVGLLFGKSGTTVFATPIETVLNRFNVTIDGK
ncbi:MAG: S1 family peptidase [Bacteroidia bacterium]|nr:S1 family peptidase [Bacteroidia bacterium]